MFTSSYELIGHAYDPSLWKWYCVEFPIFGTSNWSFSSSYGLVCFMNENRNELTTCNLITKSYRKLQQLPGLRFSDYSALAISVDRESHIYTMAIVKSDQFPENFFHWDILIHIYNSMEETWLPLLSELLMGWRSRDQSVICNGLLYFLVYSTVGGPPQSRHALVAYDISNYSSLASSRRNYIAVPCSLTCGHLMNMKEKLVMMGGISKPDQPEKIKGIGIWVLHDKKWKEIAGMPHKYFQGHVQFGDVFASSGTDDLIYIQSYGSPALLRFDMNNQQWTWSEKCSVTKNFPLQLYTGFSFDTRPEIVP